MRRREFIAGLGGAAAAWPLAARAQQGERMRRVGVLTSGSEQDSDLDPRAVFVEALKKSGWITGRNVAVDFRFGGADDRRLRAYAADLVAWSPDVIVSSSTQTTAIVRHQTSTIPIVFVEVSDPVASGFVMSFAHPAGNITGFAALELSVAGKWLNILKNIAPFVHNVMVLYYRENANWQVYLPTLESAARALGASLRMAPASDIGEIERSIESFAGDGGGGMIVIPSGLTRINRRTIAMLAERHRLPAIYTYKSFVTAGGLASYGSEEFESYPRAAEYVDRILRGEKPGDLPVQAPTKFYFVINLRAAKAIGLTVSTSLQLLADEVIE